MQKISDDNDIPRTVISGRTSEHSALLSSGSPTSREDCDPTNDSVSPQDHLRKAFGYEFKDGRLTNVKNGEGFVFKNQEDYNKLGLVINECIYRLLEDEGLELRMLKGKDGRRRGFFFASKDVDTNTRGMLVLIHGTGVVRAGQWSRRLLINHSLESGSQLPYIREARRRKWSVVVMNTNQRDDKYHWYSKGVSFVGYQPEDHGIAVWKAAVERSPARHVAIVAHSYGGHVTSCLLREIDSAFKAKVFAIALTDSYCSVKPSHEDYFKRVARNWATSEKPVGDSIGYAHDCKRVSAGTTVHEETSWKSIESVFAFLDQKFQAAGGNTDNIVGKPQEQENATHRNPVPEYRPKAHESTTETQDETEIRNAVDVPLLDQETSYSGNADVAAAATLSSGEIPTKSRCGGDNDELGVCTNDCRIGSETALHGIATDKQLMLYTVSKELFPQASSDPAIDQYCIDNLTTTADGVSALTILKAENSDAICTEIMNENSSADTHHSASAAIHSAADGYLHAQSDSSRQVLDKPVQSVVNEGNTESVELIGQKTCSNHVSDDNTSEHGVADIYRTDQAVALLSEVTGCTLSQPPSCSSREDGHLSHLARADDDERVATIENNASSGRLAAEPADSCGAKMDAFVGNLSESPPTHVSEQAETGPPELKRRRFENSCAECATTTESTACKDCEEISAANIADRSTTEPAESAGAD